MFTFDTNGNCSAGIHQTTLSNIEMYLVKPFPNSKTRKRNIEGLKKVLKSDFFIKYEKYIDCIWLDGSFCSTKESPNDIDGIVFFKYENIMELNAVHIDMFKEFNEYRSSFERNYCDLYPMFSKNTIDSLFNVGSKDYSSLHCNYQYWKGQFGFDRDDNPKGIYCFQFEEVL